MPDRTLIVLMDGKPVELGQRTEQMITAIVEHQAEVEAEKSGCVELHYGPKEVQARIEKKLGFWKVEP